MSACVDVKMFSDSDDEIQLSQVGNNNFQQSQSASYGLDVIDGDEGDNYVVSLENFQPTFDVGLVDLVSQESKKQKILYDNVRGCFDEVTVPIRYGRLVQVGSGS